MSETSTHLLVPTGPEQREACLGPDGSATHVMRVIQMVRGRWKLLILFSLYADPSVRTLQLQRDLPHISQKVLTQQLRELAAHRLIERTDFGEMPLRVEYRLSKTGRELMPILGAAKAFSLKHPA
jgi:DNA-binding HxlR family transcriptional regulator